MLLTATEIREALGKTYDMLRREFDPLVVERPKTNKFGREVFNKHTDVCAACGERGKDIELEAGHVVALEEGGKTTAENLLPLCNRPHKKGKYAGCHKLFDDGFASVAEMKNAKLAWINGNVDYQLRNRMVDRYIKHRSQPANIGSGEPNIIQSLLTKSATVKAIAAAESLIIKTSDEKEKFRLRLKIIEIMRRRSARGALEKSAKLFTVLEKEKSIPEDFKSWFHYEGGYINLLFGNHERARQRFRLSLDAIDKGTKYWEGKWASAASVLIQATLAVKGQDAPFANFRKSLGKIERMTKSAEELHGKRWLSNCLWNSIRLNLVENKIKEAHESWNKAQEHWHNITVLEGWDKGSRSTILAIGGELFACSAQKTSDAKNALRFLVRGLVLLIGARRNHPEGIRDLLFATERMLYLIGKRSDAKIVHDVALRTRDGSSWIAPYKTNDKSSVPI